MTLRILEEFMHRVTEGRWFKYYWNHSWWEKRMLVWSDTRKEQDDNERSMLLLKWFPSQQRRGTLHRLRTQQGEWQRKRVWLQLSILPWTESETFTCDKFTTVLFLGSWKYFLEMKKNFFLIFLYFNKVMGKEMRYIALTFK